MAADPMFPPYAYVPGHRPHPTRDEDGHSHGKTEQPPAPLDPGSWRSCDAYRTGFALFDRGYYWEAHEAWEGLWIAAGKTGAVGELLQGLIKLAAAGIKVRQGLGPRAAGFGTAAAEHFRRAKASCGSDRLAGLAFADLDAFATWVSAEGNTLDGSPEPAVEIVFATRLSPEG